MEKPAQLSDETVALDYQLIKTPPPRATLVCVNPAELRTPSGKEIALDGTRITVGQTSDNDVEIHADGISRIHASFLPGPGGWGVLDLDSKNGVMVNKSRIYDVHWLKPGDIVSIARIHYKFTVLDQPQPAAGPGVSFRDDDKTMLVDAASLLQATREADMANGKVAGNPAKATRKSATKPSSALAHASFRRHPQWSTAWRWGAIAVCLILLGLFSQLFSGYLWAT